MVRPPKSAKETQNFTHDSAKLFHKNVQSTNIKHNTYKDNIAS
jgi:hypothetical protein